MPLFRSSSVAYRGATLVPWSSWGIEGCSSQTAFFLFIFLFLAPWQSPTARQTGGSPGGGWYSCATISFFCGENQSPPFLGSQHFRAGNLRQRFEAEPPAPQDKSKPEVIDFGDRVSTQAPLEVPREMLQHGWREQPSPGPSLPAPLGTLGTSWARSRACPLPCLGRERWMRGGRARPAAHPSWGTTGGRKQDREL